MIRLSDPKPAYCSGCHNTPDARYVDFDAQHDGGSYVGRVDGEYLAGSEDLHLCETCLQKACEELALKPAQAQAQAREIRRLNAAVEHWKSYSRNLEQAMSQRPEPPPREIRRKAA